MAIINFIACLECKNILASVLYNKIIYYRGAVTIINKTIGYCVFCKKSYFMKDTLEDIEFEEDMFKEEIDRQIIMNGKDE